MLSFLKPFFSSGGTADDVGQGYVDADKLLAEVNDFRDTALRLRKDEEKEWLLAWAYYKGRHWVTWREDRWMESEANDRPKMVVNFIQKVVQVRLGHLIKNKPMLTGVPGNADEESRNATKTGLKVLEAYHHKLRMNRLFKQAILHMLVTGRSYLKPGWDPFAGGTYTRPNPLDLEHPFTGPLGDLTLDLARVNEVLPEPGAVDIPTSERMVYRTFLPLATCRRRWGSAAVQDLQPIDPNSREGSAMLRQVYGFDSAVPASLNDRVEVMEVYYRRGVSRAEGGEYEQGLNAIIAGDRIIKAGPTPDGYAEIPLVAFSEIETDSFYSTSVARGLIDLNKIVDVELSHQEHNRKALRPKTLIPYQAQIDPEAFDRTDDEKVEFFYPYKPEPYTPPPLPPHHLELRNAMINLIKDIGGNFDLLSGHAQSDVRSGRMVAYLQEYAGTVLGVPAENIEEASEEVGNQQLELLKEYVQEERLEAYVGQNRRMQIVNFKGADLKGMGSVRVQQGSALPTSRAEKYDRVEKWMEMKIIPGEKGMKMLNMVDPDADLYSEDEQDRQIADEVCYKFTRLGEKSLPDAQQKAAAIANKRNIGRVNTGLPPLPQNERDLLRALGIEAFEFEDHQAIVDQVNKTYRKAQAYRQATPAVRSLADAFVDWHLLLEQGIDPDNPEATKAMQDARATQAGPPGGPGGPPPPGGPPGPGGGPPPPPGGPPPGPPGHGPEGAPEAAAGLPPVRSAPGPMHG